jgi:glycine/D-amino acid oxidase-like deaminating enzyme
MKTCAIIGAGFSGLATAWHLLQKTNIQIDIYDPAGIAGGTSGLSAGLLHPYASLHAKLNWKGREGMAATAELIEAASEALGEQVALPTGQLRLAITEENRYYYAKCAETYSDVEWLLPEQCQSLIPGIAYYPGIYIKSALNLDAKLYLKGLWKACEKRGAVFYTQRVDALQILEKYDNIVIASGAAANQYPETKNYHLNLLKGQILDLEWPASLPFLRIPINSQVYIVMDSGQRTCRVGATFERHFLNMQPDVETAAKELLPKAVMMIPDLANSKIVGCQSGIRCTAAERKPLLAQVSDKCWILTAMGSKGLLLHSLFGKELADKML